MVLLREVMSSVRPFMTLLQLNTLISQTNAHAIRDKPTLKDDIRFRNGSSTTFKTHSVLIPFTQYPLAHFSHSG